MIDQSKYKPFSVIGMSISPKLTSKLKAVFVYLIKAGPVACTLEAQMTVSHSFWKEYFE